MELEDAIETSAPSVDEAIIIGLTRLAATRDEVDIEVLEEPSKGFLGIGTREARVRLTRRARQVEPEVAAEPEVELEPEPESAPEPLPVSALPRVTSEPEPELDAEPEMESPASAVSATLERNEVERVARDVAQHLFAALNLEISLSWRQEDRPTLWVSFQGKDANDLVGPQARTLNSVQYLFRTLVHHRAEGDYNLVVDADGYRQRRRHNLEMLAREKADQAAATGRTIRLRAMPANERRVIHMILRQDERVDTESVGSGHNRAITIVPRK